MVGLVFTSLLSKCTDRYVSVCPSSEEMGLCGKGGKWKQVQGGAECECQGGKRRKSRPTWSCGVSIDGVTGHFDFNYFLLQKIRSNKL